MNPYYQQINNPYFNPYLNIQQNNNPMVLPPQQIMQAKGKTSIDAIRMSPNSSVLIADETAPIVWKCTSDSLGNVTSEPFDISPHKDEKEVAQENVTALILDLNNRLTELENKYEQSFINRAEQQSNAEVEPIKKYDARGKKSTSPNKSNDVE